MNEVERFREETKQRIESNGKNEKLVSAANQFNIESNLAQYSYNFSWMGRPIIQHPQDMVAMQEILWEVKPDLIIETGIAHGGSLIFYASMLELFGPPEAKVLGIDIDIRAHNRREIESHPMFKRIEMIEGSAIAPEIIDQVKEIASNKKNVLVCLDSNHTHDHVLAELQAYAPLTSVGSYCVVFDTIVEFMPDGSYPNRPWGIGDNPHSAVLQYLNDIDQNPVQDASGTEIGFEIDNSIDNKLLISVALEGYLKRTR